jgi:putative membrane protein
MTVLSDTAPFVAEANWEHGGFWFPFGLLWLAVLGATIWLVIRTFRPRQSSGIERARDILAARYARGELTREEYRDRLDELQ